MENLGAILHECSMEAKTDLDQQLMRLTNCQGAGGSSGLSFPTMSPVEESVFYELPKSEIPVNAALDATKISPGSPVTEDPAPEQSSVSPAQKSKFLEFVEKNPLISGAALLAIFFLMNKKR
jgi:hypothetical protein